VRLAVAQPVVPPAPPPAEPAHDDKPPAWQPPAWAPPLGAITYVKEAATTLLVVLALPYVIWRLLTAPAQLMRNVGRRHTAP
jgi:hypothetical protein